MIPDLKTDADLLAYTHTMMEQAAGFERRFRVLFDELAASREMPSATDEERLARYSRRAEVNAAMAELLTERAQVVEPGLMFSWALMVAADVHRERAESSQERAESVRARIESAGGGR
ncbi:hypothetical protein [Saccharothrix lopnurensis]|uniref:Uncharacterized protein n=1 Tax=Saccharothrix lopnurensis TaxID=1670621 RepID=A0ABW1P5X4_9PSEU